MKKNFINPQVTGIMINKKIKLILLFNSLPNVHNSLFLRCLFVATVFLTANSSLFGQVGPAVTLAKEISHWDAEKTWRKRGVELKSSYTGSGTATVVMKGTNDISKSYDCLLSSKGNISSDFPKEMILYKTTVSGRTAGTLDSGTGEDGTVYNSLILAVPVFGSDACEQTHALSLNFWSHIKTNEEIYYKRNIRTYYYVTKGWFGFHRFSLGTMPVKIEIFLTGDMKLSDINKIVLPGITLYPKDFAHSDYPISYGESTVSLYIESVELSYEKTIQPGTYVDINTVNKGTTGTYEDYWLRDGGSLKIPYTNLSQKPYRTRIKKLVTGDNGGYTVSSDTDAIKTHSSNVTNNDNLVLNATIKLQNNGGSDSNCVIWIDYNDNKIFEVSEQVATKTINAGKNIVSFNFPLLTDAQLGINSAQEIQRRMRVSLKSGSTAPLADEIFPVGEVEDIGMIFRSSTCTDGTPIPFQYLLYAEDLLPYCGSSGYKVSKESIAYDYQTEPTTGLFKIGEKNNIPYAIAKMGKTAYASEGDFISDLWAYVPTNIKYNNADGSINSVVDPLQNNAYRKNMWATSVYEETDASVLADQVLYTDVYYPIPKYDRLMPELKELPLIIFMAGGGFMWQSRNYAKTKRIARWYAQQGYVVSVIDYRQGVYFEQQLMARAIIRAWQDSRAAVQWWKSSGFNAYKDGSNNPLWKVDLTKIYGSGGSAGAISMLHNATFTPAELDTQIRNGLLEGVGDYYNVSGYINPFSLNRIERVSAPTYDLRKYEPVPCLPTGVIIGGRNETTCDLVNTSTAINLNTDLPYWGEPLSTLTTVQLSNFTNLINNYKTKIPRVDKVVSLAGALMSLDLIKKADNPPILDIHHIDDGIVSPIDDYFFSAFSGNKLSDLLGVSYQYFNNFPRLKGGKALKDALGDIHSNVYKYLEIEGEEKSAGPSHYHQVAFKYGGATYDEYSTAYDDNVPTSDIHTLEPSLMLYADAFLIKDFGAASNRSSIEVVKAPMIENFKEEANHLILYPNPVTNTLNASFEVKQPGAISTYIYNIQGQQVFTKMSYNGTTGKTVLDLSSACKNLSSGLYIIKIITTSDTFTGEFIKQN